MVSTGSMVSAVRATSLPMWPGKVEAPCEQPFFIVECCGVEDVKVVIDDEECKFADDFFCFAFRDVFSGGDEWD